MEALGIRHRRPGNRGLAGDRDRSALALKRRRLVVERTARDPRLEESKLRSGIESARAELRDLYEEVRAKSGAGKASIFLAHEAFLDDPDLDREAVAAIRTGTSAGWSWRAVINARAQQLAKVEDPLVAARAVDLRDVGERVLRFLAESDDAAAQLPDHPVILIAEDLAPSDTAAIDPARVVGFATALGGGTSHTAIIARALGIPAIVGAGPAVLDQNQNEVAVLDGQTGNLWLHLTDEDLAAAAATQQDIAALRDREYQTRYEPAIMRDGYRVEVAANIAAPEEAAAAVEAGAEGVGLMRTEFLFLGRRDQESRRLGDCSPGRCPRLDRSAVCHHTVVRACQIRAGANGGSGHRARLRGHVTDEVIQAVQREGTCG